jgi:hypothetical protein
MKYKVNIRDIYLDKQNCINKFNAFYLSIIALDLNFYISHQSRFFIFIHIASREHGSINPNFQLPSSTGIAISITAKWSLSFIDSSQGAFIGQAAH